MVDHSSNISLSWILCGFRYRVRDTFIMTIESYSQWTPQIKKLKSHVNDLRVYLYCYKPADIFEFYLI